MIRMSNDFYDKMKFFITIISPAFCALLTTLNGLWGWNLPVEAITGTIAAITAFLGVCIGISSAQYKAGK